MVCALYICSININLNNLWGNVNKDADNTLLELSFISDDNPNEPPMIKVNTLLVLKQSNLSLIHI